MNLTDLEIESLCHVVHCPGGTILNPVLTPEGAAGHPMNIPDLGIPISIHTENHGFIL